MTAPASLIGTRAAPLNPDHGRVELTGISKRYGHLAAVDELSLAIAAGEFVALLGPSGCGKSTTLRMLAGLETPDSGTVTVSGANVTRLPAHRRDIHTVFQSYALFPHLDVAGNVAFPLRQRGVARAEIERRVARALDTVRLGHAARQAVAKMSGGQQQRVALARAVVDRPSVLLLDEPLSALDRVLRQEMQVELRLLQQELGVTTLLVTHDQEEALSLADRIVVMRHGRIEQQGSAEEIYDRPRTLFVARFVGEQNEFPGEADLRGRIRSDDLDLQCDQPPAAGRVVAIVRPEHVQLAEWPGATPESPSNTLSGVIRGVSIAGMSCLVLVHGAHRNVLARVPRDGRSLPTIGERVTCSWSASHVRVFAQPNGETA